MKKYLFSLFFVAPFVCWSQNYTKPEQTDKARFENQEFYEVKNYTKKKIKAQRPKNIIFLIGDGMGTSQVYAGLVANKGDLYICTMPVSGFSKTNSSDKFITDSAAGATAFSIGEKTYNGAIGVDKNGVPKQTILEMAEAKGLGTGLISTCAITHATPASFIAHQQNRGMQEEIAADFLKTDIDVFIGGGRKYFNQRKDGRDLLRELEAKDYDVIASIDSLRFSKGDKVAGLIAEEHPEPMILGRGDMLVRASRFGMDKLKKNKTGFFLMIEGSQIDWGGHDNNVPYITTEMLDFDKTIGEVLKFASKNGETLVVITADHETGGFAITGGHIEKGIVEGKFTTGGHTAVMVPVYAYGPKAELFSGIMENTDIFYKFKEALGW
ncbi:MAG: alkaline phosphatase [Cytophagales bacterium]|nr:alkaline phosphatase [Cytophagales bacterium]